MLNQSYYITPVPLTHSNGKGFIYPPLEVVIVMLDDIMKALGHKNRRQVLQALYVEQTPITLTGNVTEYYHIHLPILEKQGYIEFHADNLTVARGPQFEEVVPFIRFLDILDLE